MKKKKIDFYCGTFLTGGIETTLIQLLNHLNSDLFEMRLVILFKTPKQELFLSQLPSHIKIIYIVGSDFLNSIRAKRLRNRIPIYLKLLEEVIFLNLRRLIFHFNIRKELRNADVVVDFGMCLMDHPKLLRDNKSIIYNHFSLNHINRFNPIKNKKRVNQLINYSKIIAICDEMVDQFLSYFPNEKSKIIRIYNYMDVSNIHLKAMEGKPPIEYPYILSIGRLDETQKDFITLINGFALAKQTNYCNVKLVILGQGRDEVKLKALCSKLGVSDSVIFQGFEINPYKWIANCEFLVHSSKFEGLPTVILEAMILEKCVVASNCATGVRELLSNGKSGLLFEVGNVKELSSKLLLMDSSTDLIENMLDEAKYFLHQVSHENTIKQVEKLLLEI